MSIDPVTQISATDGENTNAAGVNGGAARHEVRIVEALLFASAEPLSAENLRERLPGDCDVEAILEQLQRKYAQGGTHLVQVAGGWMFRTADDLSFLLSRESVAQRRLSRAALETLAITAYHQPVTRAEIEEVRGVSTSKGTLDVLLEAGWVRLRGRRRVPGRPVTYGTTDAFLTHFGLDLISDLPGLEELKGAGLLSSEIPAKFKVPEPRDTPDLFDDEDPLEPEDHEEAGQWQENLAQEDGEQVDR